MAKSTAVLLLLLLLILVLVFSFAAGKPPNIIFILSDDLGYGDVSISPLVNRSHEIPTPNVQRLADEGMRFLRAYSGQVCAPSRCTLMTGRHLGHCTVRGNGGSYTPLLENDVTVGHVLRSAYTTGVVGKWGLGDFNSTGYPLQQGFDYCVGQASQMDCHNWYPGLIQNNTDGKCVVAENINASLTECGLHHSKCTWMNDLINREAVSFIRRHGNDEKPFFLFFSTTTPHTGFLKGDKSNWAVPAPYDTRFNFGAQSLFAAATSAQDDFVGAVLDEVKALNIDENTLIMFSGDNGPDSHAFDFFDDPGPFRGKKRSLHEGGVRQTIVARWPGHIAANSTTDHLFAFWDFLPTAAELGGVELPPGIDGVSAASVLQGQSQEEKHKYLYWEFCSYQDQNGLLPQQYPVGWIQAIRYDSVDNSSSGVRTEWKGFRSNRGDVLLYNLTADISESENISAKFPDVVQQIVAFMEEAHVENRFWKSSTNKSDKCCTSCSHYFNCGGGCNRRNTSLSTGEGSRSIIVDPGRRITPVELLGSWSASSVLALQDSDKQTEVEVQYNPRIDEMLIDLPSLPCVHGSRLSVGPATIGKGQEVVLKQFTPGSSCHGGVQRGVLKSDGNSLYVMWETGSQVVSRLAVAIPEFVSVWQKAFDYD